MAEPAQTIIATPAAQKSSALSSAPLGRLGRFGQVRSHKLMRSGSVKRVASAVGERVQVVASLHARFAQPGVVSTPVLELA